MIERELLMETASLLHYKDFSSVVLFFHPLVHQSTASCHTSWHASLIRHQPPWHPVLYFASCLNQVEREEGQGSPGAAILHASATSPSLDDLLPEHPHSPRAGLASMSSGC